MKQSIVFFGLMFTLYTASAQVGIGTTNPDASSALDISATGKGVLVPRVSLLNITNSTSPISSPTTSLLVWNTNAVVTGGNGVGFYFWSGTKWQAIISPLDKIDNLIDGKSDNDGTNDGSSIFLGINAGVADDSSNNKNIGIGFEALLSNTIGIENTAVGYNSLRSNIEGSYNSAFGSNALYSNIGTSFPYSGGANTAIGESAMYSNTTGDGNTATGASALEFNISGDLNTATGVVALFSNISGDGNTATGYRALHGNLASYNTANGYESLLQNTTGTGNTGMGSFSLLGNSVGNNNTAVGYEALGDGFISNFDNNTAIGYNALFYTIGSDNTAIGTNALPDQTGSNNVGVGSGSGTGLTTGSENVFLGTNSGFSTAATISGSVFVGNSSGYNATNSNRLYIENTDANANNALIYGEFGADNTTTGNILRTNSQFQIGNPTVSGYAFPATDGGANQVLQTNGSGAISWATIGTGDHDWYKESTTTTSNDINDDIFTQGNVAIGKNTADYPLDIVFTTSRGINTSITGTSNTDIYGFYLENTNTGTGAHYGSYHNLSGSGTGNKYGVYNLINNTAGGTHYGVYSEILKAGSYAGYFLGDVSIGTTTANTYTLPASRGTANQVMQSDGAGNLSWTTPTVGDITGVTAGDGLVNGGTSGAVTLNVVATNGLTDSANDVRLGGTLIQNTTIDHGVYGMTFNLNGTGDFRVQDGGVSQFEVADTGITYFGDDTYWKDINTGGTTLARLSDDGDDGRFDLYSNGAQQHSLFTVGTTVFNQQGTNVDFRIESDTNQYMFYVDASTNRIGIRDATPTYDLHIKQSGITDAGSGGIGLESSATTNKWKIYHSGAYLSFAENGVRRSYIINGTGAYATASDKRLKKNIIPIDNILNKLNKLSVYSYLYKDQSNTSKKTFGFMAQDVQPLFPELVEKGEDGYLGLNYAGFSVVAIKAIQEQQEEIDVLKARIASRQKDINEIKALLKKQ